MSCFSSRTALLLVTLVSVSLFAGCGGESRPPTSIRRWQEPTDTAGPSAAVTQTDSAAARSLSDDERLRLERRVQLDGVGYAADGAYIMVKFKAPPELAVFWQPSEMYLIDERTGVRYDRVPLMPKIGFLIARPVKEGQPGYVMLENTPRLAPGSPVTVRLGGFEQEHVSTETSGSAPAP